MSLYNWPSKIPACWFFAYDSAPQNWRMFKKKWPKNRPAYQKNGTTSISLTQDRLSDAILRFISTANLPFRVIEHPQFHRMLEVAQQSSTKLTIPSARTIRRHLDITIQNNQKGILQRLPEGCRLSIALDCWTSPFQQAFMAITGYFIDHNWDYCEILLGFEPLHGSHTGENLSKTVTQILTEHGISDRVLSVTTDNATNNNTLMQSVQDHLQSQHSSDLSIFRVPCIAHVIQLSLNELLGKLKAVPSNKEIELEWSEEKTHSFQNKRNTSGSIQITYTLKKIRGLAVFINASPQRREAFIALQPEPALIPIQDVRTRWNSTFLMLNQEWRQVEYLLLLTKPFFDFTMMLSKTKDITAHNIYSIYNKLFSHLDAAEAKLKNKGPYGDIYALATIFSPSKKLRYFSSTDWQGDIDYANRYQEVLSREFDRYRKMLTHDTNDPAVLETSGVAIDENDDCDLDAACASQNQPLEELTKPDDDEIARYLARGIERQKPRLFWKEYEKSFPTLARIARDILSIPASGAGVERLFNCARDICHYRRGQLKPSTIRGLMLHQFATNFDLRQEELEIIKEHLSQSEAALLDQTRRSLPQLEVLEPISDNEEEDQETGLEATQHTESGDNDSDDDRAERCRRAKGKQPQNDHARLLKRMMSFQRCWSMGVFQVVQADSKTAKVTRWLPVRSVNSK
ncbi:hypothetical protein PDIDSM_7871 [Penicillium digitatum]|nr:hypothetical protein PDIDSM_7871 [Penicillium digitatum]